MIEKASFTTTRGNLQKMLRWIEAPLDDQYDKAWLNIQEDEIHAVASMGQAVVSYSTYSDPFIHDIDLGIEAPAGVESLIKIDDVKDYVDFVGGEEVEVTFKGNEDENLCRKMEIDGGLHVDLYVPNSEAAYESQQTGIVKTYDEDNRWHKPSDGETLSTRFRTKIEEIERIVTIADFDDFSLSTYPMKVDDGEFVLDAFDDNKRNSVTGSLDAQDVEGPDVDNSYSRGFAELVGNISGEVWVDIEQDTPVSVVRENNNGDIILRYVLLPAQETT